MNPFTNIWKKLSANWLLCIATLCLLAILRTGAVASDSPVAAGANPQKPTVPFALPAPGLTVTTLGTTVTIAWTAVHEADGYTFFYAPYPDADYLGRIDVGNQTGPFTVDFEGEAAFYLMVNAYNSSGSSGLSNIEHFVIAPPVRPRGQQWVRDNPMFISGLTVSMGEPPADFVFTYFDDFHATATHLWLDGLPWEVDAWAAAGHADFRFVSWVLNDGTSVADAELLGGYPADAPGRIGFQIGDEPALFCSDLQCALGCSQLRRLDAWVQWRDVLARRYDILLEGRGWVRVPPRLPDRESGHHLYAVEIDFEGLGVTRSDVMERLRSEGVGTQVHYIPVVNQPYYRDRYATRPEDYPAAQAYYEKALSLPLFPAMAEVDVDRVVDALDRAVEDGQ